MDAKGLIELKKQAIFQSLEDEALQEFITRFPEKTFADGEKIFSEREPGEAMYIIKAGIVRVTRQKDNESQELAILSVGEFFGEIALFRDVLRTATAAALKPAILFELKRDKFHDFLKEKPQFAVKILYYMLGEMSKRLRLKNREEEFIIF